MSVHMFGWAHVLPSSAASRQRFIYLFWNIAWNSAASSRPTAGLALRWIRALDAYRSIQVSNTFSRSFPKYTSVLSYTTCLYISCHFWLLMSLQTADGCHRRLSDGPTIDGPRVGCLKDARLDGPSRGAVCRGLWYCYHFMREMLRQYVGLMLQYGCIPATWGVE